MDPSELPEIQTLMRGSKPGKAASRRVGGCVRQSPARHSAVKQTATIGLFSKPIRQSSTLIESKAMVQTRETWSGV